MTPHPLHRWKSFWFGILVLAFLGWAWGRSGRTIDLFTWTGHGEFTRSQISHSDSQISFYRGMGGSYPELGFYYFTETSMKRRDPWFPAGFSVFDETAARTIAIAHWFLILLFLVPWTGFLLWRVKRHQLPEPKSTVS